MINRAGQDWILIRRFIGDQIEKLHASLENCTTVEDLNYYRGKIAAYRDLIDQAEPLKPEEQADQYVS